jgi:hypothetical protein
MEGVWPYFVHLLWLVPLALLLYVSSPRFRGDIAQSRVRRILASGLEKSKYTVLNDVTLPSGGGTVNIDHVVVSRFGIFVIESQYQRGLISGGEFQDRWKSTYINRTRLFDNPLHLNYLQQQALESLLGLPATRFHPIVVLTGEKGFKGRPPEKVLKPERLIAYMRKKGQPLLSPDQAAQALITISNSRLKSDRSHMWTVVRLVLLAALLSGAYFAFRDDIAELSAELEHRADMRSSPGDYHADGSLKTEREKWEDSLVCAYSSDTGRCACYEPGGVRADLGPDECRELAERGSILNQ